MIQLNNNVQIMLNIKRLHLCIAETINAIVFSNHLRCVVGDDDDDETSNKKNQNKRKKKQVSALKQHSDKNK
jgi:hypothetical protein